MTSLIRHFLRGDSNADRKVKEKSSEAHDLRNQMTVESLRSKRKVDTINRNTYRKLKKISNDLSNVSYTFAIATGAEKRGFKK